MNILRVFAFLPHTCQSSPLTSRNGAGPAHAYSNNLDFQTTAAITAPQVAPRLISVCPPAVPPALTGDERTPAPRRPAQKKKPFLRNMNIEGVKRRDLIRPRHLTPDGETAARRSAHPLWRNMER
ncbi:hypothetical protein AAFF_G00130770 [Aldrovandia affinis]|uniref:Uncharacterized protein n=1 Tax=Aldrovandia affinis TaxID=143900 RepID=A0AAD7RR93_9TELE|nr:hypothetical protein AAFF_G00130770 [Aldrovandia affinis]